MPQPPLDAPVVVDGPGVQAGMVGPPGLLLRIVRDQRTAFVLVGAFNTVVGVAWFVLFDWLIGDRWGEFSYMVTLVAAHITSVLCAFVAYRRFVFVVRGHVVRDLARFELVYLTAFAINLVLLPLLVRGGHLRPLLAQLLIAAMTAVLSWMGHKHFSFRRPHHDGLAR